MKFSTRSCFLVFLLAFAGVLHADESLVDQRWVMDKATRQNRLALSTYKSNYFMPLTYLDDKNDEPFAGEVGGPRLRHVEIKFQISVKIELARGLFYGWGNLAIGYTQQSYWQAYRGESQPFRESVYEPEPMISFDVNEDLGFARWRLLRFSFDHQSNGRYGATSRSWNRLCAETLFERGDFYVSIKPWVRIPESGRDDNPAMSYYMGQAEVNMLYKWGDNKFNLMVRNNFSRANRGAAQFEWTYPIARKVDFLVQYFDGYGENLIDYNHHNRRIGVGIMLANWL